MILSRFKIELVLVAVSSKFLFVLRLQLLDLSLVCWVGLHSIYRSDCYYFHCVVEAFESLFQKANLNHIHIGELLLIVIFWGIQVFFNHLSYYSFSSFVHKTIPYSNRQHQMMHFNYDISHFFNLFLLFIIGIAERPEQSMKISKVSTGR